MIVRDTKSHSMGAYQALNPKISKISFVGDAIFQVSQVVNWKKSQHLLLFELEMRSQMMRRKNFLTNNKVSIDSDSDEEIKMLL